MKLTAAQLKMLGILGNTTLLSGPQALGSEMWPRRYSGSNCSAPYARPAGKILNSLRKLGLAEWIVQGDREFWGWQITGAGRAALKEWIR